MMKEAVDLVFYLATELADKEFRTISSGIEHALFRP